MSPETGRSKGLINFVEEEIRAFKVGEIHRISTPDELRERFGYSDKTSVYHSLRKHGLVAERRRLLSQEQVILSPSRDLAWFLGVLSGGGYVSDGGKIILSKASSRNLANTFQTTGEHLFKTNARHSTARWSGRKQRHLIEFQNIKAARALGNLRATKWPETILERHGWILSDQKYLWSFLEGVFDTKGGISMSKARIRIHTIYPNVANFLTNLLVHAGIENPRITRSRRTRTGIIGVTISTFNDARIFACNVHSKIPEKEKLLEFYRQMEPRRSPTRVSSREELVKEWLRLKELLSHSPSFREIETLQRRGETKFGPATYAYGFGTTTENKSGRSFLKAKVALENIIQEQLASRDSGVFSSRR